MLKLEQIKITNEDEIIVEVLEPIVYTEVGGIAKTDDKILREKAEMFYLIARVVKVYEEPELNIQVKEESKTDIEIKTFEETAYMVHIKKELGTRVGDFIMITKHSFSPIQFPIEGYTAPRLATINKLSIFATIAEDEDAITPSAN